MYLLNLLYLLYPIISASTYPGIGKTVVIVSRFIVAKQGA